MKMKSLISNLIKHTDRSWNRVAEIVKNRDQYICRYCGRFDARGEVDHILPLAKGGTDAIYNLCWSCRPCNRSKGDKTIVEWTKYLTERDSKVILSDIYGFLDVYEKRFDELSDLELEWTKKTRPKNYFESLDDFMDSGAIASDEWHKMYHVVQFLYSYARTVNGIPAEVLLAFDYFRSRYHLNKVALRLFTDENLPLRILKVRKNLDDLYEQHPGTFALRNLFHVVNQLDSRDTAKDLGLSPHIRDEIFKIVDDAIESYDGKQIDMFNWDELE